MTCTISGIMTPLTLIVEIFQCLGHVSSNLFHVTVFGNGDPIHFFGQPVVVQSCCRMRKGEVGTRRILSEKYF